MNFPGLNLRDTRGMNVSRRIALTTVVLLLLLQAVPVLACVAMPAHALTACCCEPDRNCTMARGGGACAVPEACCVQQTGLAPPLGVSAAHPDDRSFALPITHGAPAADDPLIFIEQRADRDAAQFYHHHVAPLSAVPLYLRHLRLTL